MHLYERFNCVSFYCQAIAGIAESWEQITLDIGPYKDRGHFRLKYVLTIQDESIKIIDLLVNLFT